MTMATQSGLKQRIYLDNAATTWPKPESVYAAVDDYQRDLGAPAGRGAAQASIEADRIIEQLRQRLRQLCHAPASTQVILGFNGTDVLNTAIHGVLAPGDHAIATVVDHNSVLRPLTTLAERGLIELTIVDSNDQGVLDVSQLEQALRPQTKLVAFPHASNVTGAIQPLESVAELVQQHSALLLVDAAQTLGHIPLDLSQIPIDMLASSGHKGLLGPLGTGVLLLSEALATTMSTLRQGGTGTDSETPTQPATLPAKLEAGSPNLPGLAGLKAGVEYVLENWQQIRADEMARMSELIAGLSRLGPVRLLGPPTAAERVGVCSLTIDGIDPHELASILDSVHNIQVRAGLQCAPRMHERLDTKGMGGTVRVSVGPFSQASDVAALVTAVTEYVQWNFDSVA
jgi:cysteine desulfurase family protein